MRSLQTAASSTNYNAGTDVAAGNFVINNANQTASVTNSPQTYTGSPIAATISCSGSGAVSNIKYDGSSTTPTNAATYAVTANCAAATNYNAGTDLVAGNFTINQAVDTPSVSNSGQTYTGSPITITV